jgi:secretion/DNA translocation related TadE-like protein
MTPRTGPHAPGGTDDRDRGVATVWAAIGMAVLMVSVLFGLYLGSAVVARHRAAAAADLAALAAATESVLGDGPACARAARITSAMGADLTGCALDGWDVLVQVRVPIGLPLPAGGPTLATARAAAGPVTDPPPATDEQHMAAQGRNAVEGDTTAAPGCRGSPQVTPGRGHGRAA